MFFVLYTRGMNRGVRGFTLIELLVVIAVIGILVGVVVASLNTSRARGANAAIKANMRTISQQIELQYLNIFQGSYGTVPHVLGSCIPGTVGSVFADNTVQRALAELQKQSGVMPTCVSTLSQWAVATQLKTPEGSNTYWCIETEGKAKGEAANITGTFCL